MLVTITRSQQNVGWVGWAEDGSGEEERALGRTLVD
jgi:hypothetical protein